MRITDIPVARRPMTQPMAIAHSGFFVPRAAPARVAAVVVSLPLAASTAIMAAAERRRRVIRRARGALDALERLKLALLSGGSTAAALDDLEREMPAEATGDDQLDSLIAAIELRVAVERAKADIDRARSSPRALSTAL